jgi:cellobiose phosphorylase
VLELLAVVQRLVRHDRGLIQLFDPPFDKSSLEPGYIKGYLPGVRENGGQYTHGAIWMVMALATMGEANKAWDEVITLKDDHTQHNVEIHFC